MKELIIGIPVYNGKNVVMKCLDNITKYTKNVDYEIRIFDNASTDDTINIIENKYPEVKIIKSKKNIGYAGALNKLFSATESKYIAFINSDIFIRDNAFLKIIKFMEENPNAALSSPILNQPGQGLKRNFGIIFPNLFTVFLDYTGISRFIPKRIPKHLAQVSYLEGTFMVMKREIMEKYGFFDEKFFLFMEDLDFQIRMKGKEKVFILPEIIVDHIWGGSLPHYHPIMRRERIRSLFYYFKKHKSKWELKVLKLFFIIKINPYIKKICE